VSLNWLGYTSSLPFFVSLAFAVRTPLPAAKNDLMSNEEGLWKFALRQAISESIKLGYLIIYGNYSHIKDPNSLE
jgi:hypothetical protein